MTALNAALAANAGSFQNTTVTCSDIGNAFTFTPSAYNTYSLTIFATSTMNFVIGFEYSLVNTSISDTTVVRSYIRSYNTNFGQVLVVAGKMIL